MERYQDNTNTYQDNSNTDLETRVKTQLQKITARSISKTDRGFQEIGVALAVCAEGVYFCYQGLYPAGAALISACMIYSAGGALHNSLHIPEYQKDKLDRLILRVSDAVIGTIVSVSRPLLKLILNPVGHLFGLIERELPGPIYKRPSTDPKGYVKDKQYFIDVFYNHPNESKSHEDMIRLFKTLCTGNADYNSTFTLNGYKPFSGANVKYGTSDNLAILLHLLMPLETPPAAKTLLEITEEMIPEVSKSNLPGVVVTAIDETAVEMRGTEMPADDKLRMLARLTQEKLGTLPKNGIRYIGEY